MSIQSAKDFIVRANQDEAVRKTARERYTEIVVVGRECGFEFTLEEFSQAMRERKAKGDAGGGDSTTCQCLYETGSCHSQTCQCADATVCQCADATVCQCVDATTCQCVDSTTCQCADSQTCQCADSTTCQCVDSQTCQCADSTTCQCVENDSTTCQCVTDGKKGPRNDK